jgi:hypothetical protein
MSTSLEEYVQIDKRIDAAEEQATDNVRESLRDRWEFGKRMLAERKGKQLPKGRMADLVKATDKSQRELSYRMQFAEAYPTEEQVCTAMQTFKSWRQVKNKLSKPPDPAKPKPAPKPHARHDEVVELDKQGLTQQEIADQTGIGKRQVRHIVEREHVEQEARADATVIDWATVTGKAKEREAVMRRQIHREVEAQFEPRVQAEVAARVEAQSEIMKRTSAQYRLVLNARKGILTRAAYDLIRSCLHPDSRLSVTNEKLAEAFRIFNEAEILLLNETDCPAPTRLPSKEDLLKRRRRGAG